MEEKDISDRNTLLAIASENQLDGEELLSAAEQAPQIIAADSEAAVKRGVFGAPSYLYNKQIFWGQDRLDFLDRALE